jgi:hypothetical protein
MLKRGLKGTYGFFTGGIVVPTGTPRGSSAAGTSMAWAISVTRSRKTTGHDRKRDGRGRTQSLPTVRSKSSRELGVESSRSSSSMAVTSSIGCARPPPSIVLIFSVARRQFPDD